jgi:hypothetical protein
MPGYQWSQRLEEEVVRPFRLLLVLLQECVYLCFANSCVMNLLLSGPDEPQHPVGSILLPSYNINPCTKADGLNKAYAFKVRQQQCHNDVQVITLICSFLKSG